MRRFYIRNRNIYIRRYNGPWVDADFMKKKHFKTAKDLEYVLGIKCY